MILYADSQKGVELMLNPFLLDPFFTMTVFSSVFCSPLFPLALSTLLSLLSYFLFSKFLHLILPQNPPLSPTSISSSP